MKLSKGYLVVFEGIDGTGKSTQSRLLMEDLRARELPVQLLAEPTQGFWGQKIRKLLKERRGYISPEEELSWFINDRREDVEKNIRPGLERNTILLLDRYYYSTAAYQGALGMDPLKICRDNENFAPKPDLVFLFMLSPEKSLERIRNSRDDISSFEKLEYLKSVSRIFESFEDPVIRKIDSDQPVEVVHDRLKRELDHLLAAKA